MDVENTEPQTIETPNDGHATRDDLIAAVREAGGTESVDVDAEEAAAAKPAEAAPVAATPPADDPDEKIGSVLRAREAARAKRLEADDYAAERKRAADEQSRQLIEEARAEAKRQAAEELASERAKWRSSPTATARALAGDTQEFVDSIIRDGTPEARAIAKAQEDAAQAREEAKAGGEAKKTLEKFLAEQAAEKEAARVAAIRTEFLAEVAPREKAPFLYASFRGNAARVFNECNDLCLEWQGDGLVLGRDFDRGTLVAYLEKQSREAFTQVSGNTAQQVSAGAPAKEPGNAPKVPANGSRTLSAAAGSERRTSPKPLSELTSEQARAELIAEVAAARRANPDAKM